MRIISRRTVYDYAEELAGTPEYDAVRHALDAWVQLVHGADWSSSAEVRSQVRNVSIVGSRAIFNIKGNSYRLVVDVNYEMRIVYVKWFGTHKQYDRIDVKTVNYEH